jgi:hypothetical protein
MISSPPQMEIQQSMLTSYHAIAKSHTLISVTFSTPTGLNTQIPTAFDPLHIEAFVWNRKMSEMAILQQLSAVPA